MKFLKRKYSLWYFYKSSRFFCLRYANLWRKLFLNMQIKILRQIKHNWVPCFAPYLKIVSHQIKSHVLAFLDMTFWKSKSFCWMTVYHVLGPKKHYQNFMLLVWYAILCIQMILRYFFSIGIVWLKMFLLCFLKV